MRREVPDSALQGSKIGQFSALRSALIKDINTNSKVRNGFAQAKDKGRKTLSGVGKESKIYNGTTYLLLGEKVTRCIA